MNRILLQKTFGNGSLTKVLANSLINQCQMSMANRNLTIDPHVSPFSNYLKTIRIRIIFRIDGYGIPSIDPCPSLNTG